MPNKVSLKQTLVSILAASALPVLADPPAAHAPAVRRFHDWRLDCTTAPCEIGTPVLAADGSEVMRVSVREGPLLAVTTRLGVYLADGVVLTVGDLAPRALAWRTCGPAGCEARLPLDPELAAALRRERDGTATFTLEDGVPVRLPFSLVGFIAAGRARDR